VPSPRSEQVTRLPHRRETPVPAPSGGPARCSPRRAACTPPPPRAV